jgi:hypothetical protein
MIAFAIAGWIGMLLIFMWAVWPRESNSSRSAEALIREQADRQAREPGPSTALQRPAPRSRQAGRPGPVGWVSSRRALRAFRAELDNL